MANVPVRYEMDGDREVEAAFKRLEEAAGRLGEKVAQGGAQGAAGIDQVTRSLEKAERGMGDAARGAKDLEGSLTAAVTVGTFLGHVLVDGARALVNFAKEGFESAARLRDFSEQTGFGIERLQAWGAGVVKAGGELRAFQTGLTTFSRVFGQALDGAEPALKKFRDLGVSLHEVTGEARTVEQAAYDVARALERIDNQSQRLSRGRGFFGEDFRKMQEFVEQGETGLRRWEDAWRETGLNLTVEQDKALKQLEAQWNDFLAQREGLTRQWAVRNAGLMGFVTGLYQDVQRLALGGSDGGLGLTKPGDVEADNLGRARREAEAAAQAYETLRGKLDAYLISNAELEQTTPILVALNREIEQARIRWDAAAASVARFSQQLQAITVAGPNITYPGRDVDFWSGLQQPAPVPIPPANPPGGGRGGGARDPAEGYRRADEALKEYLESLERADDLLRLTERERAIETEGLKAEKLAQEALNEAKKAGIKLEEDYVRNAGDRARAAAGDRYDQQQANRAAEEEHRRYQREYEQREKQFWKRVQDIQADGFEALLSGQVQGLGGLIETAGQQLRSMLAQRLAETTTGWLQGMFRSGASGSGTAGGPGGGMPNLGFFSGAGGMFSGAGRWIGGLFGAGGAPQGGVSTIDPTTGGSVMGVGQGASTGVAGAASAIPIWGWIAAAAMTADSIVGPSRPGIAGAISTLLGPSMEEWQQNPGRAAWQAANPIGGPFASAIGNLFGIDFLANGPFGGPPRRPQATSNLTFDWNAPAWNFAGSVLAQDRAGGNVEGTGRAADQTATALNRFLWDIGGRLAPGAQSGYVLNSQGNNNNDNWIVGMGAYGTESAIEVAAELTGEEAMARLLSEIVHRAATNQQLIDDGSGFLSASIEEALRNVEVTDPEALQQAVQTARTYDELMELGRAGDSVRDSIEDLRQQFHALEFDAGRFGLDTAALRDVFAQSINRDLEAFGRAITDGQLSLLPGGGLLMATTQNSRARQANLEGLAAYADSGIASAETIEQIRRDIEELYRLQQRGIIDPVMTGISDELLGRDDPEALANLQLDRWRDEFLNTYDAWLTQGVITTEEHLKAINDLEALYGERREDIVEQFGQASVAGLQDLYRALTYGGLSGASPQRQLEGAQSAFSDLFRQALAEDADAEDIGAFQSAAQQYAQLALQTHGTGGNFAAINAAVQAAVAAVIANEGGTLPVTGPGGAQQPVSTDNATIAALLQRVDNLTAQLQRIAAALPLAA
jgi:hypothetical protein